MMVVRLIDLRPRRRFLAYAAATFLAAAIAVGTIHKAMQSKVQAAEPLSAYVPQGSLMAVEAPDFAALLGDWTNSSEEKAWIKSDSYADFSRSRLFSRLGEAQSEFAASAGLAPDAAFVSQVAGQESVFAWYDIGKLEFLFVTRMKPGEAANNPLMKLAAKFQMRKVGADTFYTRAEAASADAGVQSQGEVPGQGTPDEGGSARTVAFAVHGDLLLLATREDLIANALLLVQHQGDSTLRNEPWYTAAVSAVREGNNAARPDLRMTLNLAKIVPSPYFRSYWVQTNVSEMKQYSAAVSDLYRTPGAFREERVLISKSPEAEMASGDIGPVLKYLPAESGVYRATALPGTGEVVAELDRRLISRGTAAYRDVHIAPVADLSDASAGNSSDLDTRIDEQPVPKVPMARAEDGLRRMLDTARPGAMLVYSTGGDDGDRAVLGSWLAPTHSAVVLSAAAPWDLKAAQEAIVAALRPRLTVGGVGLGWQERQEGGESWTQLSGLQPLALAVHGGMLIVASDSETLLNLLQSSKKQSQHGTTEYAQVKTVAGFDHTAERRRFLRLSALLDQNLGGTRAGTGSPAFFSGNLKSLSDAFVALDSETFVEGPTAGHAVRQTVVYHWHQ